MAGVCARAVPGTPISAHPQAGDVRGPPPGPRCGRGHSPGLSGDSFLPARVGRGRRASERSARDGRRASPAAVARGSLRGSVRRGASPPPGSGFQNSPAEPASATLGFATGARHCFRGAPLPGSRPESVPGFAISAELGTPGRGGLPKFRASARVWIYGRPVALGLS